MCPSRGKLRVAGVESGGRLAFFSLESFSSLRCWCWPWQADLYGFAGVQPMSSPRRCYLGGGNWGQLTSSPGSPIATKDSPVLLMRFLLQLGFANYSVALG